MRLLALLLLLLPNFAAAATSNIATTPRDTVSLISASNTATNGAITLALNFKLSPGWHIYWSNPGDAGLAPQITLNPPATATSFTYPPPELLLQGPVAAFVLSGNVLLPFTAANVGSSITATARWLVCSDICVPEHANFELPLTGGVSAEASLFTTPQIVASPFAATIAPDGTLSVTGLTPTQVKTARFFPAAPGAIINQAPQPLSFSTNQLLLKLSPTPGFNPAAPLTGVLELTDRAGTTQALDLTATPGPAPKTTPLALWLGLAFLGGLILNLMPCVFPVLAMKALAITRISGAANAHIRREALGYTAGVLTAMLALAITLIALRAAGENFGWGFQFQSPIFVALIAWLIFAIALNLAGLFEISTWSGPARLTHRGSFFTGLLAVLAATPCTAPFMGGAIAAALAAPLTVALGIFLLLGLGLAAPFLLLAILPPMARLLPRPGPWMLTLQRLLSIPMFATAIWLAWVLTRESGPTGLALLCLGALAITAALTIKTLRPAALAALLILPFLHPTNAAATLTLPNAEPYTPTKLASLRANNQPVLIDMTAAWCVTCLVNDHTTLTNPTIQTALAAKHIHILLGDWTNRNPAITQYLQSNNRDGVPLYIYYKPNTPPQTLPQILTPAIVLATIK
jgi:thiol:disulfide interchange protein DsbD